MSHIQFLTHNDRQTLFMNDTERGTVDGVLACVEQAKQRGD